MKTWTRIEKCTIPDCAICAIHRRINAPASKNKYLPRKIRVAPSQMRLGEKPERIV